jgi:decaprenyl-phosphate phosphoribosyltransferase
MTVVREHRVSAPLISELVREARPKQWLKNVLVFAAPAAAGVLTEWPAIWRTLVTFVALCAAASGTYFLNDVADVDSDRRHPTKCRRPVAAGAIPLPLARLTGLALLVGSLPIAALTREWAVVVVIAAYIALTVSYSRWLKHIAIIDLVAIAMGFVLRAIAGAVAVDVPMSNWFLICVSFGSLFVVTGKRHVELKELGDGAGRLRASLDEYSTAYLRLVLGVSASVTLLSYCLWAFEKAEFSHRTFPMYQLSIIPVVTALLRYGLVLENGRGGAPEEVFFSDRTLQALGVIWLLTFVVGYWVR